MDQGSKRRTQHDSDWGLTHWGGQHQIFTSRLVLSFQAGFDILRDFGAVPRVHGYPREHNTHTHTHIHTHIFSLSLSLSVLPLSLSLCLSHSRTQRHLLSCPFHVSGRANQKGQLKRAGRTFWKWFRSWLKFFGSAIYTDASVFYTKVSTVICRRLSADVKRVTDRSMCPSVLRSSLCKSYLWMLGEFRIKLWQALPEGPSHFTCCGAEISTGQDLAVAFRGLTDLKGQPPHWAFTTNIWQSFIDRAKKHEFHTPV